MARHVVTFADLVAIARRTGVKVVEAPSSHRGRIGEMGTVIGVTCHHTGTANSYRPDLEYPDYNVVKEGRAGLENSLSAFGLGRNSTIYVFSEDLSWHAGVWSYGGTTDGNGHFLGIEAAGVGDWTDWQRKVYPRLVASILLFIDAPPEMAPRHMDGAMPRGRKTDAAQFEGWFYDQVRWFMAHPEFININYKAPAPTSEDEVTDADIQKIVAALRAADFSPAEGTQTLQNLISQVNTALTAKVDRISPDVAGPDEGDVVPVNRAKMIEYVDARTRRLEAGLAEVLRLLTGQQPPAA